MKEVLRVLVVLAVAVMVFQSGLVCYSEESKCPTLQPKKVPDKNEFLSAHGITQDTYSIWLREHSVWRQKFSEELEQFSFIPKEHETGRSNP